MRTGFDAMMEAATRPTRIDAAIHARPAEPGPRWRRSYLRSEWLPLTHIDYCYPDSFTKQAVSVERAAEYNVCLHWPNGLPDGARDLIALLGEGLALPTSGDHRIDLTLALDWYKIVDTELPSTQWQNTVTGQLIYQMKYWVSKPRVQQEAAAQLAELLAAAIRRHPAFWAAPYIASVPGSKGDGASFGEHIAAVVADKTGKVLVKTIGPAREPRKGSSVTTKLDGQFALPSLVDGACIVIDDVYKSGMTMRATALAARQAGAPAVYGLAAAKTISG